MKGWLADRFELSRGGVDGNVRAMEGLRGFAVSLVFLVHYVSAQEPWIAPGTGLASVARAMHAIGNTGVDLFFVLSGFLIYGSLIGRPQPFARFMRRRIQRIYPAFLVVFATYIVLSFVFPGESRIPHGTAAASGYLLANALLLPGLFPIVPLITVAWSLSYEMFFYLLIPVVILLFALRRRTASSRIGFFSLSVAALAACCAWFGGPVRLIMFGAGILLYELITNEDAKGPGTPLVLVVLVVAFAFMAVPLAFAAATVAKSLALFGAFGVLCLSCFTRPQSWLARAASWTPMRWLGNMSYSFYLLHGLALKGALLVATPFLPVSAQGPGFFAALLLPAFAIAVLASAVLFLVVERPLSLRPGRGSRPKTGGATEAIAGVVPDAPDIGSMSGRPLPDRAAD